MADSTLTDLPAASALAGTELLYVVQSGADKKGTPAQILTYVVGAAEGVSLQGYAVNLEAFSDLVGAADQLPYFTGPGTLSLTTLTAAGRALINDADVAAMQTTLGLVIGTNVQAQDADLDAIAALASNGLIARTGAGTVAARAVTGGGGITVTNGDGVAGAPTLSVSNLRSLWVPCKAISPSATGGCAAVTVVATSANQPDLCYLAFDPSTAEYAQFAVTMPKNWDEGTITAKFYWSHPSTTTNFGVRWGIQAVAIGDGEAIATNYGIAQEVTDTGGSTNYEYVSGSTSAMTVGGTPQVDDISYFRVYRDPANVGDTMAVDAFLHGVRVFYTINTLDET